MIVAVEGPDKSGKTTLLTALRKYEPFKMWPTFGVHVTQSILDEPSGLELERVSRAFYEALAAAKKTVPILCDRIYVTSYVYSQVMGRQPAFDYLLKISKILRPVIVYVDAKVDDLLERLDREHDRFVTDSQRLLLLKKAYDEWYEDNPFGDKVIKVSNSASVEDVALAIRSEL